MTTIPNRRGAVYCSAVGLREPRSMAEFASWRTGPTPWALLVAGIILVIDLNLGLGYGIGALHVVPVLIASLAATRGAVLTVAGVTSLLIVLGFFLSQTEGNWTVGVFNRGAALAAVWTSALIAVRLARVRAEAWRRLEAERVAAMELQESMRSGLTKLLTLNDQVARSGATGQQATQRVRARAQVLLTVLGILTRSRGEPVELAAVLRSMLPGSSAGTLRMEGPELLIPARQVHALVLVFHELLSNCRAYGALSADAGVIDVQWDVEEMGGGEEARRVTLRWRESGGPAITSAPTPGFGTSVISSAVVHDLSGSVELAYPAEGCRHELRFIVDLPEGPGRGRLAADQRR